MSTTTVNKNMEVNDFTHLKIESACWSKCHCVHGGTEGVWMYRGFGQTVFLAPDSEEYKELYGEE
jgi:hypothetical protein